jgi:hypothetical protein
MLRICAPSGLAIVVDSFLDIPRDELGEAVYDLSLWLRGGARVPLRPLRASAEVYRAQYIGEFAIGRMLSAAVFQMDLGRAGAG